MTEHFVMAYFMLIANRYWLPLKALFILASQIGFISSVLKVTIVYPHDYFPWRLVFGVQGISIRDRDYSEQSIRFLW